MDGYSLTFAILKDKPEYLPVIKQCLELQREAYKEPVGGFGFETTDAQIISLADTGLLFINKEYPRILKKHPRYLLRDMLGVERALQDIENKQILLSAPGKRKEGIPLSEAALNKLQDYITREKLQNWPEAEAAVIERAVNDFISAHDKEKRILWFKYRVYCAEDGLLSDIHMMSLYSPHSEGNIHLPLLNTLRHEMNGRIYRLKERMNSKSKYLAYSSTDEKSVRCYIYCYCDEIVIDINIEKSLGDELSAMGFDIRPRKSYRTRAGWLTGWHVPYGMLADNSKRDTIINYIDRAFILARISANQSSLNQKKS